MNAAIIDKWNEVIFEADLPADVRTIEVAGAVTNKGYPVNRHTFRVSRSRRNLKKACEKELLSERRYGDLVFYVLPGV